jgi:hypothetical protein
MAKKSTLNSIVMATAVACVCGSLYAFPQQSDPTTPQAAQPSPDNKEVGSFTLVRISDGTLSDNRTWWKTFSLLASNGHHIFLTSIPFTSAKLSTEHLRLGVKSATKIIRRNPELNATDEVVGERVLALFPAAYESQASHQPEFYHLFWTYGAYYWEIRSERLEDVLALEDRLNKEGTQAVWGWVPKK